MAITISEPFIVHDLIISRDMKSLDIIGLFHLRPYTTTLDTNYEIILDMYKCLKKSINKNEIDFRYVINGFVLIVEKGSLNRVLGRIKESHIHIKKRYKYVDDIYTSTLYRWKNQYIIDDISINKEPEVFICDNLFEVLNEMSDLYFFANSEYNIVKELKTKNDKIIVRVIRSGTFLHIKLIEIVEDVYSCNDIYATRYKNVLNEISSVSFKATTISSWISNLILEDLENEKKSFWKRIILGKK